MKAHAVAVRPKPLATRPRAVSPGPARPLAGHPLDRPPTATRPEDVLQLQRDAGNAAVAQLVTAQRAPAATAAKPKGNEFNDLADFLNGFQSLAVAAVHHNGRGLAVMKFGADLSAPNRKVLEGVQRVLFLVQRGDAAQIRRARSRWPALAAQLREAVARAKALGVPKNTIAVFAATIETIGTDVIGRGAKGDDVASSPSSYADFAQGVSELVSLTTRHYYDFTAGVTPTNYKAVCAQQQDMLRRVQFAASLSPAQRKVIERLRRALVLARTPGSAKEGLSEWQAIAGDVWDALDQAQTMVSTNLGSVRSSLADIAEKLIKGSVYLEAHNAALEKVDLKNPGEAFEAEKIKVIAQDLAAAKDVADKAESLVGAATIDMAMKKVGVNSQLGSVIWDLAKGPGEVMSKLEAYEKRGVLGKLVTIADLGDKMLSLRNAVYQISFSAVKEFAEQQGKAAVTAGVKEAVERWGKVAKWASDKLEMVEKVGKVAGIIGLAVSAIKVIDAIANGDWGAAIQEVVNSGISWAAGAAGTIGGAAGVATIGGIGIILAAQAEAISGAAAMIRYCKQANVREAALDFVHVCEKARDIEVRSLIADLKVLSDASFTGDREFVQARMTGHVGWWHRHLFEMQDLLNNSRPNHLGGRPDLKSAMGPVALGVLGSPPAANWEVMAEQIKVIFSGANSMSAYVVKNYPRASAA